jgi:hypothetical protein
MGQLPRSEYSEFSGFSLGDLIGKRLDFWYGDHDKDFIVVDEWKVQGPKDDGLLLGFYHGDLVIELGWPSSDCPVRVVD